jgi:hypothetical protein
MTLPLADGLDLLRQRLADGLHLAVAITTDRNRHDLQISVNAAVIAHPVARRR